MKTTSLTQTDTMPLLFVGHGSPMNAIEENEFVPGWRKIAGEIAKPNAILCISAHWETEGTQVTAMEKPRTIHDFGGFPEELYQIQYPAHGTPELAEDLSKSANTQIKLDFDWGLDHGTWSVLKHFYPDADVHVMQVSLDYNKSPHQHYEFAKELAMYRRQGILILGSGNIVHNLRMVAWDKIDEPDFGFDWALEANERMKELVVTRNHDALINYKEQGTAFRLAAPTPDHFLPLLYVLALQEENEPIEIFNDKAVMGSLTMTSFKIG